MPQSLRSILGKPNRVRKPGRPSPSRQNPPSPAKASPSSPSPRKGKKKPAPKDDPEAQFQDKLSDVGVAQILQEELTLRDVVQAMRYVRNRMFTPVPPTGFKSTRSAEILNYRLAVPPIVTPGHLHAILTSPSKVEREVVELSRSGVLRKVRVERRAGLGEALIEAADFEAMVRKAGMSEETKDRFLRFLRESPTAQTIPRDAVTHAQTDELVRAGFLTSSLRATPGTTLHVRPEDRTTLTSIHHVSRFASGSVSAVGGQNALHLAGGSGGAPTLLTGGSSQAPPDGPSDFRIAVPGHGRYLKLAEGTVDWLREMVAGTRWGEAPEDWFRERFEGGGLYGTRWKDFWGVQWEWVLGQAVGLGVVEVFETGSVGRGLRALGG
ncbi:serine-threonine protein kinase 19 domain-containing protein [Trichoderma novae-zelandiae]